MLKQGLLKRRKQIKPWDSSLKRLPKAFISLLSRNSSRSVSPSSSRIPDSISYLIPQNKICFVWLLWNEQFLSWWSFYRDFLKNSFSLRILFFQTYHSFYFYLSKYWEIYLRLLGALFSLLLPRLKAGKLMDPSSESATDILAKVSGGRSPKNTTTNYLDKKKYSWKLNIHNRIL